MSPKFKLFLIACAIALPLSILIRVVGTRLQPQVACTWQENGEIQEAWGEDCDDAPEGALILRPKQDEFD